MRSIILVGLLAVSGCYGLRIDAEYEHHSSIPMIVDLRTSDQIGAVMTIPLSDGRYAPELELGAHWEVKDPVFGINPVGTLRLRQPVYVKD